MTENKGSCEERERRERREKRDRDDQGERRDEFVDLT